MANAFYQKARERAVTTGIDWSAGTIKCVFVDSGFYTPNLATDEFLSDIPVGSRVGSLSAAFTTKTIVDGVLDADDVTQAAVSGVQFEYVVIFKDTGTEATSPLIAFIDTATGLPHTPSGGDINIVWDNGANKIGKI